MIKYPVIIFEKNDSKISSTLENFLMGDKRYLKKAFKNVTMVDSNGSQFIINGVKQEGGINFLLSVKYVGLIVKYKPIIERELVPLTLAQLKERIINHVLQNKAYWSGLNDGRGLDRMINDTQSFEKLIKMFR